MNPINFDEATTAFGPPPGIEESQVMRMQAYVGAVTRGSLDGFQMVVTAWKPTAEEIELIRNGSPIFLSFIGGLPPHFVTTSFAEATNPA